MVFREWVAVSTEYVDQWELLVNVSIGFVSEV
jgi:hypothetical protein